MPRPRLTIALCVQLALTGLAMLAIGAAAVTAQGIARYNAKVTETARVQEAARLAEHMNAMVHATVSESRGIYMSRDIPGAERFARPMRAHLEDLGSTLARFRGLIPADDPELAELARVTAAFIGFRTEMIGAALTEGPAAANTMGNNEANRANRQALNRLLLAAAGRLAAEAGAGAEAVRAEGEALAQWLLLATGAGVLVALAGTMLLLRRRVTAPLARLTATMRALAADRLETPVPDQARRDEIGEMARALAVLKDHALEAERLRAARELERESADAAKGEALRAMAERLEAETRVAVQSIEQGMARMQDAARSLSDGATLAAGGSREVAGAATESLASTEAVAAAAEELSASIRVITERVGQAMLGTRDAVARTEAGTRTVAGLAESVERIGAVARLIADIAARTNLLALNATIEAARAGEAGKGFAVVAGEVKALATQTTRSTEEISRQIAEISAATADAVAAIRSIGESIAALDAVAAGIGDAMEQQDAATGEIARAVARSAQASQQVSGRIAEVAEEAGRTGATAVQVKDQADAAAAAITELRSALVRTVRTATAEVDRRFHTRVRLDLPVRLTNAAGVRRESRLRDISLGGAAIAPTLGLTSGERGRLEIPGLGVTLAARVLGEQGGVLRVSFPDGEAESSGLAAALAQHGPGQASQAA